MLRAPFDPLHEQNAKKCTRYMRMHLVWKTIVLEKINNKFRFTGFLE